MISKRKCKKLSLAMTLVMLLIGSNTMRADFVDDINATSNKYGYGHRVIYEMNVGGFTSAGTFAAAQAQLESLKLTGVDVIWLMPIYPRESTSPGINSPYGPVSYTKTNPSYGTIAQLKSFVDRAHELNMEVWLDWVPNHTATNAEWVTDSVPTNYYKYSGGSIVHPNSYSDVIQLDYSKQTLRNSMDYAMKFWIREAGIDGYRCDYISSSEIPADYWTWQIPRLRTYAASLGKSDFWMLGEANFLDNSAKKLFNTGWDYDYMWNLFEPTLTNVGSGSDASTLKTRLTNHFNQSEYSNLDRMAYLNNHDEDWNDKATMTSRYGDNRYAFNVLIFTFYGMPLIYNGQEIGYSQNLDYFHDTKINWNSVDNKMKNTIRTLTALKHNVEAFQDGKTFAERGSFSLFNTTNSVVAYKRSHGDSEAIVILNLGSSAATVSLSGVTAGSYELCLNSQTIASGVSKESVELTASPTINVEARGYRVYVKGGINMTEKSYTAELTGNEVGINKATFTMNATVDGTTDSNREVYGYYTTDGTEPTSASNAIRHGDVITIDEDCTLKFRYRTSNQNNDLSSTVTKNVSISYSTSENYSNYKNNIPAGSGITVFLKTNHANPTIWGWKTDGGADLNPGELHPGNTVTNTTESGWLYKTFATDALTFHCTDAGNSTTADVSITEDSHFLYVDGYLIKLNEYDQRADSKYVYFAQPNGSAWPANDINGYSYKNASLSDYGITPDGYTVFVKQNVGWDNASLHLYTWSEELFGGWAGKARDGEVTIDGTTYSYFKMGAGNTGKTANLIINNGNGGNANESKSYNFTINSDLYLDVTAAGSDKPDVTAIEAPVYKALGNWTGTALTSIGTLYSTTGNTDFLRLNVSNVAEGTNLIFNTTSAAAVSVPYSPYLGSNDEISVFYKTDTQDSYYAWVWTEGGNGGGYYTDAGNFPGDAMTLQGTDTDGKYVYKYVQTKVNDIPNRIIISNAAETKVVDSKTFTNHGVYTSNSNTSTTITQVGDPTISSDAQANDVTCIYGNMYYATDATTTTLNAIALPTGTKQQESIDDIIAANHIEGDVTYLLSPTWTGSTNTNANIKDWTGNVVATMNAPEQNTAATQTVRVPRAGTYMVQAIVRATRDQNITLSLNGNEKTIKGIGKTNTTVAQVDRNGRVDKVNISETGGWQKIEHQITLAANQELTISLKSTANTGSFEFSDVTLLENPNTPGMFYTTAGTTEAKPYADLTGVKKFSFFDRGDNINGLVRLSNSAVQAISGHEHPANIIISEGGSNTCDYLYLTDNDDSGASWNNRHAFATNVAFTANAFSFDRTFPANQHVTLCLPFALTADELQSLFGTDTWYAYQGISDDGSVIRFEERKNVATVANQPMLIIPTISGQLLGNKQEREASVSPISAVASTGFLPTYSWMEAWNTNDYVYYLFNTDGQCVKVGSDGFDTKPFRAYIKIPAAAAKETMTLSIEQPQQPQEPADDNNEEVTDIRSYNANDKATNLPAYNIAGQRVGSNYRGIVIAGGKKIIR